MSAKITPPRPSTHVSAPSQSTLAPPARAGSGSTRARMISVAATGTTLMAKIQRHDAASTSAPPSSGPAMNDTPVHAVHAPIAFAWPAPEKLPTIIASELGTSNAPAIPCSARATISTGAVGANAHASDVTAKPIRPAANTRLRPNRSDSDPASRIRDPNVSRYASTIHCCVAMPPPSSACIAGSATFTTELSRNATNEPRMLASRTPVADFRSSPHRRQ